MVEYAAGTGPGFVGNFSIDISRFVERSHQRADRIARRVVLDIFSNIVQTTPVDTGFARSNWQVTTEGVSETLLENPVQHLPYPRGRFMRYSSREGEGRGIVGNLLFQDGFICNIYNNTRYIIPLEYGHSNQAPRGMVRVTIISFQRYVAEAAAGL